MINLDIKKFLVFMLNSNQEARNMSSQIEKSEIAFSSNFLASKAPFFKLRDYFRGYLTPELDSTPNSVSEHFYHHSNF